MTTTDTLLFVKVSGKWLFGFLNGGTDGATETEITLYDDAGGTASLGQACEGKTLQEIRAMVSDGSIASTWSITDETGGKIFNGFGNERITGDPSPWNIVATGLQLKITKAMKINIATAD